MRYTPVDNQLYAQNRARFMKAMQPNSIALFCANLAVSENGDAVYSYKANSDIVWLSGIVQEKTMVVLYPENKDGIKEIVVIQRPNADLEKWNGHLLRSHEATEISGIQHVLFVDNIEAQIRVWMHNADIVYLNTDENDRLAGDVLRTDLFFVESIQKQYPLHKYERAARIMKNLRAVKTKQEVELVKEAISITDKAFRRVCSFVKPGVMEYEIEAEITHEFIRNRATRHAYGCILASGDRARILHYIDNNQECKDGELLLMDFGAEYGNYCADMSRTIPVNGKFSKRQKEVYDAVLQVHRYCASILKPALNYAEYMKLVNTEMEKQLVKIGLITKADIKNQDPAEPAYRKYFYHGIGHHLGIDVHDLGTRNEPVKEGMLFTIEPGIYIEEEQMGIRIENNFWLTKTGNIDLFKNIPITTEEIEAAMKHG